MSDRYRLIQGDACEVLSSMPSDSVDCCITSPPYYALRDYGCDGQIGLESTPEAYIEKLVAVFREMRRVLRPEGTCWVNIGDSYWGSGSRGCEVSTKSDLQMGSKGTVNLANLPQIKGNVGVYKNKDLIGIPWMLAFALRNDGWYLRQDIIWAKPNPMPESVKDRCTRSHEYIFLLSKSNRYYYDAEAIKEPTKTRDNNVRDRDNTKLNNTPGRTRMGGLKTNNYKWRNKRDVWNVATVPFSGAHFATFPERLIAPCILAGCPRGGVVLDMFNGTGTTGVVALKNGRKYIGIEMNEQYIDMANERIERETAQLSISEFVSLRG